MTSFHERTVKTKLHSNAEILELHNHLNNELEKFHQIIASIKKQAHSDTRQLEQEKIQTLQSIQQINKKIQSLIVNKKHNIH